MTFMDIEEIRAGLQRPGKTQRGLANAMGVDAAAVNRLLAGKRQLKASEIDAVRNYLAGNVAGTVPNDRLTQAVSATKNSSQETLKVLGMAEGGPDGWSLFNGEVIEEMRRPDNLLGVAGAYAVYVIGTSMEPRFHAGELVHIHPHKPPTPGSYVLVQKKPLAEGEAPLAVVKRLVKRSGNRLILAQFSPAKEIELKMDEVVSIHRVVGSSEA